MKNEAVKIGQGALTWCSTERKSDRYGTVMLDAKNSDEEIIEPNARWFSFDKLIGKKGELFCIVTKTRNSTHIGDPTCICLLTLTLIL